MLDKRVISALLGIPLLLFFVIYGSTVFKIGVAVITVIALMEYINVYKRTGFKVISWLLLSSFFIYYLLIFIDKPKLILPLIYLVVLVSMSTPIFCKTYNVISSALTITGFIYIVNFFGLLIFIREHTLGSKLIWLVFIIAFFCDTFAYYTGRAFGKRKLCPEVSPKKTIEGSIGGIIGSIVGVILWGYLNLDINFVWYRLALLGIAGGIISQIGDLSASLIKRYVGIKDYGNIMPGHGGILDRFDSILFTAPVVYYYISLFLG
jgi:phosphatidate cytidylyltransferase